MTPPEPRTPRILMRSGRLLASVLAFFYVASLIGEGFGEGFDVPDAETAAVVVVFTYAAVSTAAAWLNERVGGAMLVTAGVALVVLVATTAGHNHAIAATFIGGPFLLAGAALLWGAGLHVRWRRSQAAGDR